MAEGRNEPRSVHFGDLSSTPALQKKILRLEDKTCRVCFSFNPLLFLGTGGEKEKELGKMAKGTRERKNLHHQFFTFDREEAFLGGNERRRGKIIRQSEKPNGRAPGCAPPKSWREPAAAREAYNDNDNDDGFECKSS